MSFRASDHRDGRRKSLLAQGIEIVSALLSLQTKASTWACTPRVGMSGVECMLNSMKRARGQTAMKFRYRGRGGYREGAGRPKEPDAGVPHRPRAAVEARHPVHVTVRVRQELAKLRSKACFRPIAPALAAARERFGFRLIHFSVQANHLHLVVEVDDARALARGMQGLGVRIARALNRALGRRGKVFADRYHAHVLRSPREVANAVAYVVGNAIIHATRRGEKVHPDAIDPMSSGWERQVVVQPRTWLLRWGWMRTRVRVRDDRFASGNRSPLT
jgi:putative transposase